MHHQITWTYRQNTRCDAHTRLPHHPSLTPILPAFLTDSDVVNIFLCMRVSHSCILLGVFAAMVYPEAITAHNCPGAISAARHCTMC